MLAPPASPISPALPLILAPPVSPISPALPLILESPASTISLALPPDDSIVSQIIAVSLTMPEVLMTKPPTEQDTVDLFELDDKQGLSFRIITRTLIAEKNGEDVAQLKLAIGTGSVDT